ncbi:MAG: DNA alkylation repair protein [Candidatus Gracilibacteria bacterium]|nr:DNA alkylation repair protein [Candidatus Gracilibacteria bacterium]
MFKKITNEILSLKNPDKAKILQGFFKTGIGEYGEGDIFLGITVPELRNISKKYISINFEDIELLLKSEIHDFRFIALCILRLKYEKGDENAKKAVFDFSIKNIEKINNWDLVDTYVHYTIGDYILDKDREILYKFSKSENLWIRRISIISTFAFIKRNLFEDTLKICEILLNDKHDLIHKATGWMLREAGKRDKQILINFLDKHSKNMPRTMLRYSIEKLSKEEKELYMKK